MKNTKSFFRKNPPTLTVQPTDEKQGAVEGDGNSEI